VEKLRGKWTDGNEAIHAKIERSRPWCGTVFRRNHDGTEADALVAMTFGAHAEEAVALAREIAAGPADIERLTAENARKDKTVEFTRYWWSFRFRRIEDLAKEKGIWPEVAAIFANGTASPMEPPKYAQLLNGWQHRAKAAEAKLAEARAALEKVENANEALAAARTDEQYLALVDSGQGDLLLALDNARLSARAALATIDGTATSDGAET
jgi:hypothetical protein